MKKMAQAFFGRHAAYRQALAAGDVARLTETIARNVYPAGDAGAAAGLAAYVLASRAAPLDPAAGTVAFADLAAYAGARAETAA